MEGKQDEQYEYDATGRLVSYIVDSKKVTLTYFDNDTVPDKYVTVTDVSFNLLQHED